MGLIKATIKNKKIVLFLVAIAIISGFYCYHIIPKQESPDVSSPVAMITTIYPGASSSDIEKLVTKKIEEKVEEIDGYDYAASEQIQEQLKNIPGTLNVRDDAAKKTYEYEVNIDDIKASQLGLLKSDILK